ncbi:hypothetical protein [Celeribacter persicus]|uniref:Uncharacterized protein n=1 Tax=Celeribacter persicus TaxID=1651082 RepID=A0A2T5HMD5_9RHOB|nr:hypothetical protein [Celeribacter persicus]PTQ72730.1 hypothetical protein C8N42_106242 [Celeribacter persicus]
MSHDLARNADEARFMEAVTKLDEIEQLIILHGMRAMARDEINADQFQEKYTALLERYRAGEELTLADLGIAYRMACAVQVGRSEVEADHMRG